jgi:hypothetical protein
VYIYILLGAQGHQNHSIYGWQHALLMQAKAPRVNAAPFSIDPPKKNAMRATTGSSKHVTSMDIANMHARHVRKSGCRHESSKTFLVCHADLVYVCAKSIDACHVRQVSKHQHPSAQVSYPIPAIKFGQVFSTKTPDHVGDHSEKCSDSLKVCNLIFWSTMIHPQKTLLFNRASVPPHCHWSNCLGPQTPSRGRSGLKACPSSLPRSMMHQG